MIQRIQTVYMLASVVAILTMLVWPLGVVSSADAFFDVSALGISSVTEAVPLDEMRYGLFFLILLMMVLPFVCIFLYKKQKLQLHLVIYTGLLDILFYAYFFLYEAPVCQSLASGALTAEGLSGEVVAEYDFTLYAMPVVSLFCCVMAWRGIIYDIALLASADRLRPSRKK